MRFRVITFHYIEQRAPFRLVYFCQGRYSAEGVAFTESGEIARRIVHLLADRQAEEIVLLDVRRIVSIADYFVIASATNPRQMRALVDTVEKELRRDGVRLKHQEGALDSGWVLLDYGDVVVHLFSPELRAYYRLEELWRAATPVVRFQ